ncbi:MULTISPECIES: Rieske (2Fe-2S) protein [unclassified Nocardioides]|uniref:Rieske (2Fe-2S) protein n=1 Tax=unclassified Nocardioides TaxID=2615069 RepID=UPI0006FFB33C|nr:MULTISPECIES: Rieske (2Fe-2S) protein [unclassified Nocardioides]KRA32795.1 hypothetical protein ASD81_14895 [Nocardioides sp. Root614]KRA89447.1 hypothetical protein ASD84_15160 [Nocardioides sp. Root682]
MTAPFSRRRALTSAATLGVSVPLLAACGDDGDSTASDDTTSQPTSSAPTSATTTETADGATSTAAAGGLVAAADVPVGGGVVLDGEELVVTQPTAGKFQGYSAVCTHQGCLVTSVANGKINCPCHGSSYNVADGSVAGGPAPSPLSKVTLKVEGDQVVRG